MGVFDSIKKAWSGADFWDKQENANQKAAFAEEERKKRERQILAQQRAASDAKKAANQARPRTIAPFRSDAPQQDAQNPIVPMANNQPLTQRKQTYMPIKTEIERPVAPAMTPQEAEIEAIAQRHLPAAMEQEKRMTSWADRTVLNRGDHDKRAMANARNRAVMEYQEKYGFNQQPEVAKAFDKSRADLDAAAEGGGLANVVAPALSLARVGIGIPQGLAGLYDLATPGKGTNRVSQALDSKAKEIDTLAQDMDITGAYKTGNVAGEFASYLIPGTLASKVGGKLSTAGKGTTGIAKYLGKGLRITDDVVAKLAGLTDNAGEANMVRRFLAERMRQNFTIDEAIEELLITGRYMGQNTGRGGDTSWQSVGLDVASGVGGGLLFPTKGFKNLLNSPGQEADEVTGAVLASLSEGTEGALSRNVDEAGNSIDEIIPPDTVPNIPDPNEVAPGVIKTGAPPVVDIPTQVPPAPEVPTGGFDAPVIDTTPAETPAFTQPGTGAPITTGTRYTVPQAPQGIQPQLVKRLEEAGAGVDESAIAPVARPDVPTAEEVATQTELASEAAAATNPIPVVDEARQIANGKLNQLMDERAGMKAEGMDTREIDAQIRALQNEVSGRASSSDAEADARVAEADAETQAAREAAVTSEPARAELDEFETGKTSSAPEERSPEAEVEAKLAQAEATTRVVAEQNNGFESGAASQKVTMTESVGEDGKKVYLVSNDTGSGAPTFKSYRTEAGAQAAYDKKASLYKGLADNRAKSGGKGSRKAPKTVPEEQSPTVTAPPKKKKTVAEPIITEEVSDIPQAPTKSDLQKGARDNTTKAGKVSDKWIKEQLDAGANRSELISAVEKVEGKSAPKTADEKFVADTVKQTRKNAKSMKGDGEVKAAPNISKRGAKAVGDATENKRIESAYATYGSTRNKADFKKSFADSNTKIAKMSDDEFLTEVDNIIKSDANKPQTDYDADLATAKMRLTEMLSGAIKNKDEALRTKIDNAYGKIADIETSQAASRGEGLGFQGFLTHIQSPALSANHFKLKLQKMVKAAGGDPEKAISDDEFVKFFDAKKAVSDVSDELTAARGKSSELQDMFTKKGKNPTRKQFEKVWGEIEDNERLILEKSDAVDDVIREIRERLSKDGLLPNEKSWIDTYEAHVKGAMLSGLTGRGRDAVVTKVINQTNSSIENGIKTAIDKIASGVAGKKLGNSGSFGSSKTARAKGWKSTVEKISDDWAGRTPAGYLGDPAKTTGRAEIPVNPTTRKRNPFLRTVHTATAIPTHGTESTRTKRLFQAGMNDAERAGLKGKDAKLFADNYVFNAPPEVKKMADQEMLAISGMHNNPVTKAFVNSEEKLRAWANSQPAGAKRKAARLAVSQAMLLTAPFKKFMGGSIHYALDKNAVTQGLKILFSDVPKFKAAKAAGDQVAMAQHLDDAFKHMAAGTWDVAKVAAASVAILPHLSDTDAEGNSYSPPYLKVPGTETYIPMSTFGFAATPILHAWALRKGVQGIKEEGVGTGAVRYGQTLMTGIVKSTGLDNVMTGDNGIGRLMSAFGGGDNQASGEAGEPENLAAKTAARLGQDIATQWTPAAGRDINALINFMTGEEYAPETKVYNEDGKRNWVASSARTVASGIPIASQMLPRSDTKKSQSLWDRFFNANTSSDNYLNDKKQTEDKMNATKKSLSDSGAFNNPDLKALLGDDNEKLRLYDKLAKGETEGVQQSKIDALITDMTSTDAQKKFVENGNYKTYKASLSLELEKMNRDPNSSETEKGKVKRDITRADLADTNKVNAQIYALYTGDSGEEGAGISQTELNKMLNKEDYPESYDPETAFKLIALDELFTQNKVSNNTNGIDPWTKPKYVKPKDGWGGSGGGGGGGDKTPKVSTDVGDISGFAKPEGSFKQKYEKLVGIVDPLPNLTTASAKTNLKKKISVAKGVQL